MSLQWKKKHAAIHPVVRIENTGFSDHQWTLSFTNKHGHRASCGLPGNVHQMSPAEAVAEALKFLSALGAVKGHDQ